MAKTLAQLLEGEDMEGGESFCDYIYNGLKNNWHQSDPLTNMTDLQPGMKPSDSDDNKLWHIVLKQGVKTALEVLQGDILCGNNEVLCANNQVLFTPYI